MDAIVCAKQIRHLRGEREYDGRRGANDECGIGWSSPPIRGSHPPSNLPLRGGRD